MKVGFLELPDLAQDEVPNQLQVTPVMIPWLAVIELTCCPEKQVIVVFSGMPVGGRMRALFPILKSPLRLTFCTDERPVTASVVMTALESVVGAVKESLPVNVMFAAGLNDPLPPHPLHVVTFSVPIVAFTN